jgi:hypothetical protein
MAGLAIALFLGTATRIIERVYAVPVCLPMSPCPGSTESLPCSRRWWLGTYHGAISEEHLDYYLDEFTFRFNRRTSRARGLLFYRLIQQAVEIEPAPYHQIRGGPAYQGW